MTVLMQLFRYYRVRRTWQSRRIIITEQMLAFSHENKEVLIDMIPLAEITAVRDMNTGPQGLEIWSLLKQSDTSNQTVEVGRRQDNEVELLHSFLDLKREIHTPEFGTSNRVHFQNAFTVETIVDGHNSGRIYHLRAESLECCRTLVDDLTAYAAAARRTANARNRFRRAQERIRQLYASNLFQYIVVVLILLVCCLT